MGGSGYRCWLRLYIEFLSALPSPVTACTVPGHPTTRLAPRLGRITAGRITDTWGFIATTRNPNQADLPTQDDQSLNRTKPLTSSKTELNRVNCVHPRPGGLGRHDHSNRGAKNGFLRMGLFSGAPCRRNIYPYFDLRADPLASEPPTTNFEPTRGRSVIRFCCSEPGSASGAGSQSGDGMGQRRHACGFGRYRRGGVHSAAEVVGVRSPVVGLPSTARLWEPARPGGGCSDPQERGFEFTGVQEQGSAARITTHSNEGRLPILLVLLARNPQRLGSRGLSMSSYRSRWTMGMVPSPGRSQPDKEDPSLSGPVHPRAGSRTLNQERSPARR